MKPVVIFRFAAGEGPGFFADFLSSHQIPYILVKIDEGESLPDSVLQFSGMVLMGGPMSVNDDLPWIMPVLALIQEAYAADIPLLGHCLGGQLISRALGATVARNPLKEIGWGEVAVHDNAVARAWFGEIERFNGFHWHGDTFQLPPDAVPLLASQYCENQGYAIGKHLALQCHVEMTPEMVANWCEAGAQELASAMSSPAVQTAETMLENLPLHCFFLNKVATCVYRQWIRGLVN